MTYKFTISGILVALLMIMNGTSQVTVNPGAGSYSTIKLAFDAINNGTHTGVVTVLITGNTTETVSAVLNASGTGTASYSSVSIYPTVSGLTISGDLAVPLIDLNGADNVTIDGRLNASGSTIDMTITNTNITNVTSTIRFTNDATTNTIKYCTLKGAATQLTVLNPPVSGIIHIGTAVNGNGNDDNVISNNNITNSGTRLQCAIFASGTNTIGKENSGVIIRENNIYDILRDTTITGSCIYVVSGNTDLQITANSFYETTNWNPRSTTYYAINIDNSSGNNFNVSNNFIGGSLPSCGGAAWTKNSNTYYDNFMCIYMNVGTTTASNIQGNTITNWNYINGQSNKIWYGINIAGGSVNIGTTTANTIGAGSSTGAITVTKSHFYGIYLAGSGVLDIQNNTIGSITNTTLAYSTYGIYAVSTSGTLTIKNNTIGSTSSANSIYSSSTTNAGVWGINVTSTGTTTISGNTLANISSNATIASTLTGIRYSGSSNSASIFGNFIRDISYTNAVNIATLKGIDLVAGTNSTYNNIISLGNNNPGLIYGIATAAGTNNIYFNTVYLSGTPTSGAYNSAALYSSAANTRNIRNNIFSNARSNSGATGNHYAAYFGAAGTGLTLDYNDYFVSGSGGLLGYYNSTSLNTLTDWKTATGQDANSLNTNPSFSNPVGTNSADYYVSASAAGVPGTGITTDYIGNTRTTPRMGAWEINGLWKTWTGTTSNSWNTSTNWSPSVVPASSDYLLINSGLPQLDVDFTVSNNLTINSAGTLTINAGKTLITGGNLTLKSDANGTASIGNSAGIISGNITVERYIPANGRRYRFLSSPVVGGTTLQWRDNAGNTSGRGIQITGSTGTVDASTNNAKSAFNYLETNTTGDINDAAKWASIDGNTTLTNGKGYRVFVRGDRSISLTTLNADNNATTIWVNGTYPTGTISLPVNYTLGGGEGWNLVGNPYPSAIDWNASSGWTKTNLNDQIAVYRPSTNSYAYYTTTGNVSSNAGSNIIGSSQAFWVKATDAPQLTCTEAVKTTSAPPTLLLKTTPTNQLKLKLTKDSSNIDETVIAFGEKYNDGFIETEDVCKLVNATVNISSVVGIEKYAAINFTSTNYTEKTIPLSVWGNTIGNYELALTQLEGFDANINIFLRDNYLNTFTAINENKQINFTINNDSLSKGDNRFELLFKNSTTNLDRLLVLNTSVSVYPNPASDLLNINISNAGFKNSSLRIYNLEGQQILSTNMIGANAQLNILSLSNGIYFVIITNENGFFKTVKFIK